MEILGTFIKDFGIVEISDKFKKREFVVEEQNERDPKFNNFFKIQLTNNKCNELHGVLLGSEIKVLCNLVGRKIEKDGKELYFTSIDAFKVISIHGNNSKPLPITEDVDDLPY